MLLVQLFILLLAKCSLNLMKDFNVFLSAFNVASFSFFPLLLFFFFFLFLAFIFVFAIHCILSCRQCLLSNFPFSFLRGVDLFKSGSIFLSHGSYFRFLKTYLHRENSHLVQLKNTIFGSSPDHA